MSPMSQELLKSLKASAPEGHERSKILTENFLGHLVKLWASGNLSNFDYLMLLNYLCGRTFCNPNHYPVLPWVSLFTSLTFYSLAKLEVSAMGHAGGGGLAVKNKRNSRFSSFGKVDREILSRRKCGISKVTKLFTKN